MTIALSNYQALAFNSWRMPLMRFNLLVWLALTLNLVTHLSSLRAQDYTLVPNPSFQSVAAWPKQRNTDKAGNSYRLTAEAAPRPSTFVAIHLQKTTLDGATNTLFSWPASSTGIGANTELTVDDQGNVYLMVWSAGEVWKVTAATGFLTRIFDQSGGLAGTRIPYNNLSANNQGDVFMYNATSASVPGIVALVPPTGPLRIVSPPQDATAGEAGTGRLSVFAVSPERPGSLTYQWLRNGTSIAGATAVSYLASEPGSYTVTVGDGLGLVTSAPANFTAESRQRLVNISIRGEVTGAEKPIIAGFVVRGDGPSPTPVLIRGVGPSLAQFGVSKFIEWPVLTVMDVSGKIVGQNRIWNGSSAISFAARSAGAFPLVTIYDAALLLDLSPGNYTAVISALDSSPGAALLEVYDLSESSRTFSNISARAKAGAGDSALISGFVVSGNQTSGVLVRGIGPGLAQFGVSAVLSAPVLSIYDSAGKLVGVNSGWSSGVSTDATTLAEIAAKSGAFPLALGAADCAFYFPTLRPGNYTAQVSGVGNATGQVLIEVYQVP